MDRSPKVGVSFSSVLSKTLTTIGTQTDMIPEKPPKQTKHNPKLSKESSHPEPFKPPLPVKKSSDQIPTEAKRKRRSKHNKITPASKSEKCRSSGLSESDGMDTDGSQTDRTYPPGKFTLPGHPDLSLS